MIRVSFGLHTVHLLIPIKSQPSLAVAVDENESEETEICLSLTYRRELEAANLALMSKCFTLLILKSLAPHPNNLIAIFQAAILPLAPIPTRQLNLNHGTWIVLALVISLRIATFLWANLIRLLQKLNAHMVTFLLKE